MWLILGGFMVAGARFQKFLPLHRARWYEPQPLAAYPTFLYTHAVQPVLEALRIQSSPQDQF
jgi:hypothetical protein